jgi:nitrate/nitrite transporter NarK
MASVMVDRSETARSTAMAELNPITSSPTRPLVLATISFALSFAAWGLVGGLASVFTSLYSLTASQTALLVAVPVLLGSLARLPMGMLTDRFGGRLVFTALLGFSSLAAFVVPLTTSYTALLLAAFLIGMAGSSFAVGAAFVSRWTPAARQRTSLGVYGLGTMGQSLAVFVGPAWRRAGVGRRCSTRRAHCCSSGPWPTRRSRGIPSARHDRQAPRLWWPCCAARQPRGCSVPSTS